MLNTGVILKLSPQCNECSREMSMADKNTVRGEVGIRVDLIPTAERALANTTPELATREGLATAAELVSFQRPPDIANLANGEESVVIAKQRSENGASTAAVTANVEHGYGVAIEPISH